MLDVVCFKWKPAPYYRSKFSATSVNVLASMVARNYKKPHRFNCITDDPKGINENIRIIPLWNDHSHLISAYGSKNPSCYRRLKVFSAEAEQIIGPRFVTVDLDVVITNDLSPLWDRPEDFVIWKSVTPATYYNGSMLLLKAGTRKSVWEDFHPVKSIQATRAKRQFGSDQAWISLKLGPNETTWAEEDGVYSWRLHIDGSLNKNTNRYENKVKSRDLPPNARIVMFHGADDPWESKAQSIKWVRENWK